MRLLDRDNILASLESSDSNSLFLDPLLDSAQVGNVTVDLRLGYDFLVSVLTRKPLISVADVPPQRRGIGSYFQETRRELGERFVLYPGQLVVTTTLEYLALPSNYYVDVLSRSSYTRLGVHVNTMVQPGFRGCVPLELFNHGNNAVELVVGSRICQARFFELESEGRYMEESPQRKYYGDVRPTVSKADRDPELARLM